MSNIVTITTSNHTVEATHSAIVTPESFNSVLGSKKFRDWIDNFDPKLKISKLEIRDVDMFGPNVGFVKINTSTTTLSGKSLPGILTLRGNSVTILPIVYNGNQWYVVGTMQPRVPVGRSDYLEIPAGMLDDESNFAGVAAKELFQETKIKVNVNELVNLCELFPKPKKVNSNISEEPIHGTDIRMGPSVGGCDETIGIYLYVKPVTKEELHSLNGLKIENKEHDTIEKITIVLVPYDEAIYRFKDAKALCALGYLERLLKDKNETILNLFKQE